MVNGASHRFNSREELSSLYKNQRKDPKLKHKKAKKLFYTIYMYRQ